MPLGLGLQLLSLLYMRFRALSLWARACMAFEPLPILFWAPSLWAGTKMVFEPFHTFLQAPSLWARAGMAFEPFLLSHSILTTDLSLLLGTTLGFLYQLQPSLHLFWCNTFKHAFVFSS